MTSIDALLARVSKPGQYIGNEINVIKKDFDAMDVKVCLIFPDKYEMGMSHIGLKILYSVLNSLPNVVCERCFAPETDMADLLRAENIPLFSLESKKPLKDFDIVGFSFTYELTYTNFLNILDLAQIPLWQKERNEKHPLIIAGGGCTMNAEPVAEFLDVAALGDGEELVLDIVRQFEASKNKKESRAQLLDRFTSIEGMYVPSFFEPSYNDDGTISAIKALKPGYEKIKKRVLEKLDGAVFPTDILVPSVKLIHDRVGIEIQRGCNRACRFCQAGYIDRPVRQRSPDNILEIAEESLKNTGMDQISLLSLSAADYGCIVDLMKELNSRYAGQKVSISVPATRTEKLGPELIEQIKQVRKTGFTVAPEAGTARMRRVINKGNKVDDLFTAVNNAFSAGWNLLKLYYMCGLPFEQDEDVLGIADEANQSLTLCMNHSRRAELNLSISSFVPKPHTPFQWAPQMTIEETKRKYNLIKTSLVSRRINFKHHDAKMSYIEGILSRGDRRVAQLLYLAFKEGCHFDEWQEHFDFSKWESAIAKWSAISGVTADFYLHRERSIHEILPWDHLFAQMEKKFLWDEYLKAAEAGGVQVEQADLKDLGLNKKRLKPLPEAVEGFTEDCSIHRCSDCGVCDFKEIKNKIFVPSEIPLVAQKANREWKGWKPKPVEKITLTPEELEKISQPVAPLTMRAHYYKTGLSRYMGHLELMGVFKRAIKRLGFNVFYSQGFHPHMKISMSHPLPLGVESEWEYFDLELGSEAQVVEFKEKMNEILPEGLYIESVEKIDRTSPSLYSLADFFQFKAMIPLEIALKGELEQKVNFFNQQESFSYIKEGKRASREIDLKNWIKELSVSKNDSGYELSWFVTVSQEGSINPYDFLTNVFNFTKENLASSRVVKKSLIWKSNSKDQDKIKDFSSQIKAL